MIFFSRIKERLSSHGSSEFSRNAQDVSADNFSPSNTRKGLISSVPIIPSKITTLLTSYPRGTITTVGNPSLRKFHWYVPTLVSLPKAQFLDQLM